LDATPILVGSVAKGTFLREPDIDVFIRFSPKYSRKEMEKMGLAIARAVMPNGYESYAEHPYLRGAIDEFKVDLVPCYKVDKAEDKISAVDRTPFHTEFVKKHLKARQNDEVRLLKQFMKGIGAYGAEARVKGFSGYLCELLIIKYGSFANVLKNAAKWKRKVYLHLGNGGASFKAPLVFVDPVDSKRNVASAVAEEKKSLFTIAAREFLKSPSLKFFFPSNIEDINGENLRKLINTRGTRFYVIRFEKPELIDDVLYPQIRRTMQVFIKSLEPFRPVSQFYYVDSEVVFIVELERALLPVAMPHEGPPVWHENADKFIEKWKNKALRGPYIKGSRLYVDRMRDKRTPEEVLLHSLRNYKLGMYFESKKGSIKMESLESVIGTLNAKKISEYLDFKFPWVR